MSSQGRPSWAAEPKQQDVLEIMMEGYHIPLMSTFDPDVDKTEDNTGVFGYSGTIDTTVLNRGTLNCEGIKDPLMQILYDIASRQNPTDTGIKTNIPRQCYAEVVRLRKSDDKNYYTEVEVYHKVNFVLPQAGGGPKERGRIAFSASCDISPTFVAATGNGISATWDIVELTKVGTNLTGQIDSTIAAKIVAVPSGTTYENAGKYALSIKVQVRSGDAITAVKSISFDANTVTAEGVVTIPSTALTNTGITIDTATHAHILVLQEIDSADLSGTQWLNGAGIECRGMFDTPG